MKRTGILMMIFFLCCLSLAYALADDGVNVEVITADGVSVVVLTPESTLQRARRLAMSAAKTAGDEAPEGLTLPEKLTIIGEEAFAGIAAKRVEVSENVVAIENRAFADCKDLREIYIPETVREIDEHALDGCKDVTVYGVKESKAEEFAKGVGFKFVDLNAGEEPPTPQTQREQPAVELPLVPRT